MGIDHKSLNEVVFNDYLYENPEVHNSFLKDKLRVLFDIIDHDVVIKSEFLINKTIHPENSWDGKRNLPYQPTPVAILKTAPNWQVMAGHDKYKDLVRKAYHET